MPIGPATEAAADADPLTRFHPEIASWFKERVGDPTDIQARSWPLIAQGRHILLTAPTGSGKTLTAFLWAIDRFLSRPGGPGNLDGNGGHAGPSLPGTTRVLYVSPLKALNNDIRRNLIGPLEALRERFTAAGLPFPDLRVQVRSGDTPASERRRMLRSPPEILITTPESLNLLLLTPAGREGLRGIETVILDEIHAVAGSKRGVHLITAVDRLVPLAGEFQRIAISATVKPLPAVAAWVAGFRRDGAGYIARPIDIVESRTPKRYQLQVRYPVEGSGGDGRLGPTLERPINGLENERWTPKEGRSPAATPGSPASKPALEPEASPEVSQAHEGDRSIWERIAGEVKSLIGQARSTLIFANNRRLSERIARLLNEGETAPLAYAHHGSLSREIRAEVETRMKEGRLPAIVATSSLELGIDIGSLDQVVLLETPASVAAALQRLGRAGHGVGQVSRGVLFASHGRDLLDAAVSVRCVLAGDIEDVRPVENPLDILAQILVAMAVAGNPGGSGEWKVDDLYDAVRASAPYRNLPRRPFDLVLEMLAGRYQETRIPELRPRLAVDAVDGTVRALKGAPLLVSLSGGTIPDRGYYALRLSGSKAKIGELDEEFVWERREGEAFTLGSQSWRITAIGANAVEVAPAERNALMAPFWRAEERDRGAHFSLRLAEFLEEAEACLAGAKENAFARDLGEVHGLDVPAAASLLAFLKRQREATGAPLPHRHLILVEDAGEAPGGGAPGQDSRQVILHAPWGGKLMRPWSLALAAAWEDRGGAPLEIVQDDQALLIRLPRGEPALALLDLVHPGNLEDLLRKRLEKTGWFAAHFRENAARALLLPRSTPRSRVPLWLNRQRSTRLLEAITGFGDFPIVLETWRECLRDEFDLEALKARLAELQDGTIRVREARTAKPSPFADGLIWKQTNQSMYERDRAPAGAGKGPGPGSGTRPDLLREVAFSSPLRPRIPLEAARAFAAKAQRLAPGYAPIGPLDLIEWVKERVLIPWPEWERLLPLAGPLEEPAGYLEARLVAVALPGAARPAVVAVESLDRLLAALETAPEDAALGGPFDPASPPPAPASAALAFLRRNGRDPSADEDDLPLDGLLIQWLRAYGPVPLTLLRETFGAAFPRVEEALGRLSEEGRLILDALTESPGAAGVSGSADGVATATEVCETGNLETLLRILRRRSRPALRALPAGSLPLFSAAWHGLTAPGRDVEGVENALEKLFGWPAPAAAWEADLLPARLMPYHTASLDAAFRDSDLLWFGAGRERIAFAFPEDLELFLPAGPGEVPPSSPGAAAPPQTPASEATARVLDLLLRTAPARLDFAALSERLPLPAAALSAALWDLAWQGRITNDTYAALRRGVESGFRTDLPAPAPGESPRDRGNRGDRGGRHGRFQRWKAVRPLAGSWFALESGDPAASAERPGQAGPLEREELAKDRARQLLRRHGILFRELLLQELPALQWSQVFRALRLMELSGEALSGHFFEGIPGLQFLAPSALPLLEGGLPSDAIYWMSALDPASPAGLGLEGLPYALPPRAQGNHLVFHGAEPALVSRRQGKDLVFRSPPGHPYLVSYLGALRHQVDRAFQPLKALEVETINGVGATGSPYLGDLLEAGFEKGLKTMSLRRRYA